MENRRHLAHQRFLAEALAEPESQATYGRRADRAQSAADEDDLLESRIHEWRILTKIPSCASFFMRHSFSPL